MIGRFCFSCFGCKIRSGDNDIRYPSAADKQAVGIYAVGSAGIKRCQRLAGYYAQLAPVLRFGDRNLIHFIGKRSVKDGKREAVADRESVLDRKKALLL